MSRTTILEKSISVLVPPSWENDDKGKYLEGLACKILQRQSYDVIERIRFTGMEIDLLAKHKPSGDKIYVECKFHSKAIGANVIDVCVGQAFRKKIQKIALFSIGPLGKEAKGAIEDLKDDERISFSYYGPTELIDAIVDSKISYFPEESELPVTVSHANLIVHPEMPFIWLLQDQKDGKPYRLLSYSTASEKDKPTPDYIRVLLDSFTLLEGLPVVEYLDDRNLSNSTTEDSETLSSEFVSQIVTADALLDYRPCRPEDFVGRVGMQKELWDFLKRVRDGKTNTRLLSIIGGSGLGKSSLVAKLAERFKNKKWKNKFFLFPVDVRSARGPMFVAEAILQAIKTAKNEEFIEFYEDLVISDANNILSSYSIKVVQKYLRENNKVLVLFFDQFEEVFTKDELLPIFRVFKRFSLDVNSEQSNLVVGFSWRTGISLSDDNPAYQLWHELSDYRLTKKLNEFDNSESSKLISQFEALLKTRLLPPLRRRLLEQSQGLPWLLKKLCIHVYNQLNSGASQLELLGSRLNVQSLFNEDLEPLSEAQITCLKFIAGNSPADSIDVYERFNDDTVSSLLSKRIIVRTGQRFSVYWDIFRDYLNEGVVPAIPWTYIPNSALKMFLKTFNALWISKKLSIQELSKIIKYSESTTFNIITDLTSLVICQKDDNGKYGIVKDVTINSLIERVRSQFSDHIIYRRLISNNNEKKIISKNDGIDAVRNIYSSVNLKAKTRDNYFNRLIPWFEYSGLIELSGNNFVIYPLKEKSPTYGKSRTGRGGSRESIFIGAAPPKSTLDLFKKIITNKTISKEIIMSGGHRNAAQDLTALKLAQWDKDGLKITLAVDQTGNIEDIFKTAVNESTTIEWLNKTLKKESDVSKPRVGELLAKELGRELKQASALRYLNGIYRYWKFVTNGSWQKKMTRRQEVRRR